MIGQTPGAPRNYETEGIVTAIDIQRSICKVICNDGRIISNVTWGQTYGGLGRSALNYSPVPRERVRVVYDQSSNPYISCSMQPIGFARTDKSFLGKFQELDDTYFYRRYNTGLGSIAASSGTSRPLDQIPGDTTITQGGATIGATNSGSIFIKSSSLAQIFLSKIDDIVRVVTRNYQQFSEVAKKTQTNVVGRIYQYHAWYYTGVSSRADAPEYEEVIGDVAAGDFAKGELVDPAGLPASDDRLYKRQVNNDGIMRYQENMDTNGEEDSISTDGGANHTFAERTNTQDDMFITNGTDTSTKTNTALKWKVIVDDGSSNGMKEITAKYAKIEVIGGGSSDMTFNDDGTVYLNSTTGVYVDTPEVIISNCDKIDLGNDASEHIVMGEQLGTWFESVLKVWNDTHTHIGNLGSPTSPPIAPFVVGDADSGNAAGGSGIYSARVTAED